MYDEFIIVYYNIIYDLASHLKMAQLLKTKLVCLRKMFPYTKQHAEQAFQAHTKKPASIYYYEVHNVESILITENMKYSKFMQ